MEIVISYNLQNLTSEPYNSMQAFPLLQGRNYSSIKKRTLLRKLLLQSSL